MGEAGSRSNGDFGHIQGAAQSQHFGTGVSGRSCHVSGYSDSIQQYLPALSISRSEIHVHLRSCTECVRVASAGGASLAPDKSAEAKGTCRIVSFCRRFKPRGISKARVSNGPVDCPSMQQTLLLRINVTGQATGKLSIFAGASGSLIIPSAKPPHPGSRGKCQELAAPGRSPGNRCIYVSAGGWPGPRSCARHENGGHRHCKIPRWTVLVEKRPVRFQSATNHADEPRHDRRPRVCEPAACPSLATFCLRSFDLARR
ncbi:hypothetical protein K0M31_003968 [Melipona bicolor]|uniref:Uncharacterized protein n=1 Tax=Melipona bicolor TaxID=60889 RepID=A0AA40FYK8_9HYME|nr:hypothetical protein K0M31_003968 [Melipona bicolor]